MNKIIEFFKNLFGKKWEYVPTEYASPVEQLVASKRSAIQDESVEAKKKVHANPAALAGTAEVKKKKATKKAEPKKQAKKKAAKKKIK